MVGLIAILCVILLAVIVVQIGKITELASKIRGEEQAEKDSNNRNAAFGVVFMILFLVLCVASAIYYQNWMLGYGPHESASEHGYSLDSLFNITLFFTGIVFIITQILLFWFAYKYRHQDGRNVLFMAHDTKLEVIWTAVPAVVMTFLVVGGLDAWNEVMADVPQDAVSTLIPQNDNEYIEIEATGMQFAWLLRYPGNDGKLGTRDFKKIDGVNPLGQVWTDTKNLDDFHPSEIVLPVGRKVRVRIMARDVLHNFDLPHFRVKMDAVPGLPTYFVFTPVKTTEEYRQALRTVPEYNDPADPDEPDGPKKWEAFNYELACAELCGTGHFSMKRIVRIVSEEEYVKWLGEQQSYYLTSIRNTDADPFKGKLLDYDIKNRSMNFSSAVEKAITSENEADRILRLDYVTFATGSATLTPDSKYELENLVSILKKYSEMKIEVAGHTDNVGDPASNLSLSDARANAVYNYLTTKGGIAADRLRAVGYGQNSPVVENDTPENRKKNRRTEFKILSVKNNAPISEPTN